MWWNLLVVFSVLLVVSCGTSHPKADANSACDGSAGDAIPREVVGRNAGDALQELAPESDGAGHEVAALEEVAADAAPGEVTVDVSLDLSSWPDPRPRTSLAMGFHVVPDFPAAGVPFSLLMASDSQLWWNSVDGEEGVSDEVVEAQSLLHIDAMNLLIAGENLPEGATPPIALVMNGDLTEYGRWDQWDAYYRLFETVQVPIFDGLGNHDYENNNYWVSNGCAMNAEDMEAWMIACQDGNPVTLWGEDACTVIDNVKQLWSWCALDVMRRVRFWLETHAEYLHDYDLGSVSYSWEIGDFHFVQLHSYPGYEVPNTEICSGIAWMKHDLKDASQRQKKIVLAMHKPISSSMKEHLRGYQYDIVGIFYGHHHAKVGYTDDFLVDGVPIPEFYSGSVEWNIFSFVEFEADRLTVTAIDSNTGLPVHGLTEEGYDNLNGAHAATPFTYVFPTHDCPDGQIPQTPGEACVTPDLETPPVELCY
jgi:hypothetical protein